VAVWQAGANRFRFYFDVIEVSNTHHLIRPVTLILSMLFRTSATDGLMTFFWVKSPCGFVGRSQRFQEARHVSRAEVLTSALKMETAPSSETLASTNKSTRRFNPKVRHQHCRRREKS
jgi:hypothetical protein